MVDMSATLIHHGHIRLLREASKMGTVIVALTTDDEILRRKGYRAELTFEQRKEILESIRYVEEVVPSEWLITEAFLDYHRADLLIHGSDNSNPIRGERLCLLGRTEGISSSILRVNVLQAVAQKLRFE